MISKQQIALKSFIVNTNNHLNGVSTSFNSLNEEFHLGKRLVDTFPNHFFFHKANRSSNNSKNHYCNLLNNIVLNALLNLSTVIIVSDTSIKNNVTMSITHIHLFNSPLKKTLHHAINVTSMEAKLFTIRYEIN